MKSKIKVRDFISLIEIWEKIFRGALSKNLDMADFLKELKGCVSLYGNLDAHTLLEGLNDSLPKLENKSKVNETKPQYDFQSMDIGQVKELLSRNLLNKEQLLLLGEVKFGMPSGSYRKTKKNDLITLIESAIENDDTLKIIGEQASKTSYTR